ncbi:MAG: HAD family hydrolase [Dehalococcoidales bacterium]|nr:HAD family hydrolase [Dehalococcoidales bacterium]
MIKAVFFDMYNTLVCYDPPREESQANALKQFGFDFKPQQLSAPIIAADEYFYDENAKLALAKRSDDEKKNLWAQYEAVFLKEAGIMPTKELITGLLLEMKNFKYEMVIYEDVIPTLTEIKNRELITGLVSNADRDMTAMLERLQLNTLLDVIVTSQEVGFTKPHRQIFEAVVDRAGIKAEEAIYIGDQYKIDVLGAINAGMSGILLDRSDYYKNDGIKEPRITNLGQLIELI